MLTNGLLYWTLNLELNTPIKSICGVWFQPKNCHAILQPGRPTKVHDLTPHCKLILEKPDGIHMTPHCITVEADVS